MSEPGDRLPAGSDVAVVGGGLIGLAVAYELGRRGRRVLVLERGDLPGVATRAAAGMLAPTSEVDVADAALVELGLESVQRYPEFVAGLEELSGLSCEYRTDGTLWVALNRDQEAELEHLAAMQRAKGLVARRLGAGEVPGLEPHLSPRVVSGLLAGGDHQVDPRRLVRALEAAIARQGGRVVTGCRVTAIDAAAGRVRAVAGLHGEIPFETACDVAVLAAGAWSAGVVAALPDLSLRPVKGQVVRLRGPVLLRHVVRSPGVYLVPRRDGELVVGGTMEEQGFDAAPTAGAVLDLLREAWRVVPGVYDLAVAELSVGFRPACRDHRPVIGGAPAEGLFVATGHFRNGILLAPATAHHLAELIVAGTASPALAPFGLDRLTPGATAAHATAPSVSARDG